MTRLFTSCVLLLCLSALVGTAIPAFADNGTVGNLFDSPTPRPTVEAPAAAVKPSSDASDTPSQSSDSKAVKRPPEKDFIKNVERMIAEVTKKKKKPSGAKKRASRFKGRSNVKSIVEPGTAAGTPPPAPWGFPDKKEPNPDVSISLIVSAEPQSHFLNSLKTLRNVQLMRNVAIGEVIMVGAYKRIQPRLKPIDRPSTRADRSVRYPKSAKDLAQRIRSGSLTSIEQLQAVQINDDVLNADRSLSADEAKQQLADKTPCQLREETVEALTPNAQKYMTLVRNLTPDDRTQINEAINDRFGTPEELAKKTIPEIGDIQALGLTGSRSGMIDDLVKNGGIEYSPVWIVEANDKYHVFEGSYDPLRLFTSDGKFIEPN